MHSDLIELSEWAQQPHIQKIIKKSQAETLSADSVQELVKNVQAHADEQMIAETLELIALSSQPRKHFKVFREALPTDELRQEVDEQWKKINREPPPVKGWYRSEAEAEEAWRDKLLFGWDRGRRCCAMLDFRGSWFLTSNRNAELALANQFVCRDVERVIRDAKKQPVLVDGKPLVIRTQKKIPVFSILSASPNRREFEGVVYFPDPAKVPKGFLNLYRGVEVPVAANLKWWARVMMEGRFNSKAGSTDWGENGGWIAKAIMLQSYSEAVGRNVGREEFSHFLKQHLDLKTTRRKVPGSGRARVPLYFLPPLQEARKRFHESFPALASEKKSE